MIFIRPINACHIKRRRDAPSNMYPVSSAIDRQQSDRCRWIKSIIRCLDPIPKNKIINANAGEPLVFLEGPLETHLAFKDDIIGKREHWPNESWRVVLLAQRCLQKQQLAALGHYYTTGRQILGNQIRFSHGVTYHSNAINSIYQHRRVVTGPQLLAGSCKFTRIETRTL